MVDSANQTDNGNVVASSVREDVFYLGFNKDTGELVDVVPPVGRTVNLSPVKIKKLSLGLLSPEEKKEVLEQLKGVNEKIKTNALPPRILTFVDLPNHSVCCGSCGGVPFCWC